MADVWFNVGSDLLSSQMSNEAGNASAMPQKIPAHKSVFELFFSSKAVTLIYPSCLDIVFTKLFVHLGTNY